MNELDSLRNSTDELLSDFSKRVNSMKGRKEYATLIRKLDTELASKIAREYFGEGEFYAVGIDGSMIQNETLEMLLFYVNSVAYACPFFVKDRLTFNTKELHKVDSLGSSNAVPLWLEDLGSVADNTRDVEVDYSSTLTEVSFSLMLMAELKSAFKAAQSEGVRIIFLDRSISGSFQSLMRDIRYLLKDESSSLFAVYGKQFLRDLYLMYYLPLSWMNNPAHGPYIVHSVVKLMFEGRSLEQAVSSLGLTEKQVDYVSKRLKHMNEIYPTIKQSNKDTYFDQDVIGYKERLLEVASKVSDRFFAGKEYPLKINGLWLRTKELNTVNIILLASLLENCIAKDKLLLGITKDTSSTDVSRSVLQILNIPAEARPGMRHDRIMFTILSATNEDLFSTPWRSVGYDACFATLSQDEHSKLKAARKVASIEKLFVKSFFQTRSSNRTIYRSPVFLYDRPFMEDFDGSFCSELEYLENGRIQKIRPYIESKDLNSFDNMILYILSSSDHPEVFESYGHNILLYMADKDAKADVKLKEGLLLGITNLKLTPLARNEKLFSVIRRYRDARAMSEQARSEAANEIE
ncbi:MAG: hypothetical protein QXV84_03900 [Conexivisphaerales archaeon]